jgi:Ca-activated chloride channel family protein
MNADQPDYHDAILDRGLAELVGGETPPDLSERILAAVEANQSDPVTLAEGTHAMSTAAVKQTSRLKSWAILAASIACIGTIFGLVTPSSKEAQDLARLAQRKAEGVDLAQAGHGTRDSDGLKMVVTPHVIIQEGEEDRLGIVDGVTSGSIASPDEPIGRDQLESAVKSYNEHREAGRYSEMEKVAKDLYQAAPNEPVAQQVWDNAKFIRREMLNRELSDLAESGAVPASNSWQDLSRRKQEQESSEKSLNKSASTDTNFGFSRKSEVSDTAKEQKKGATGPSGYYLSDDVRFAPGEQASEPTVNAPISPPAVYPDDIEELSARGKKYAAVDLGNRSSESVSEPTEGTPISELNAAPNDLLQLEMTERIMRENLARRPARGESRTFDIDARFRQKSLDVQSQINDAETLAVRVHPVPGFVLPIDPQQGTGPGKSGDQYTRIYENPFITAKGGDAVSTFSIDVDTASYANVRQFLQSGQLPPPDAVRIEELLNYFPYNYEGPKDDTPFAAHIEVAACPWNPEHRLARIAIKGKEIDRKVRPQSNLVFLIDVSGSMDEPNKLPLLIDGMKLLTRELGENDKVSIVVYASSEGMVLPSTRGDQQQTILTALDNLRAGGSTAGGAGIELAYKTATENFVKGGVNRVILCTDGDFNVGVTDTAALTRLAEEKAKDTKVFLTVLGFGRGNLNDAMMEAISGKGNGNYHYVDNLTEARKVLVEEMSGTLVTIAKDVKIQVEFNPAQVAGYRLIGYENRMLRTEDFNDDKKDAGEIGAGHTVTALYEIIPPGETVGTASVDPLKYQTPNPPPRSSGEGLGEGSPELPTSDELLTLKLRYKLPDADTSTKLEFPITDKGGSFADATDDFQFAAAVASFGMLLRNSEHKGNSTFDAVQEIAQSALGEDPHGYRGEFLELVRTAKQLTDN